MSEYGTDALECAIDVRWLREHEAQEEAGTWQGRRKCEWGPSVRIRHRAQRMRMMVVMMIRRRELTPVAGSFSLMTGTRALRTA
eukprot:1976898-Rhodomonas_salina.2